MQNETIVDFGLRLLEGCWHVYAVSPSGIGPESISPSRDRANSIVWRWKSHDLNDHPKSDDDRREWTRLGFWSENGEYYLRPGSESKIFNADCLRNNRIIILCIPNNGEEVVSR